MKIDSRAGEISSCYTAWERGSGRQLSAYKKLVTLTPGQCHQLFGGLKLLFVVLPPIPSRMTMLTQEGNRSAFAVARRRRAQG